MAKASAMPLAKAMTLDENLEMPWLYPRGTQALVWRGYEMHLSHQLQFYRGCLFCNVCGARSARLSSANLQAPCRLRPLSHTVGKRLRRMLQGIWPDPGDWPEPLHTQCHNSLVYFLE